jgi:hypothetical protein
MSTEVIALSGSKKRSNESTLETEEQTGKQLRTLLPSGLTVDLAHRDRGVLRRLHPLPVFDDNVYQEPLEHVYFVYDKPTGTYRRFKGSCTGIIAAWFPQFDREKAYMGMLIKGRMKDPHDQYYNMTKEQIFAQWKTIGDEASCDGRDMHDAIELDCNGQADRENDAVWSSSANKESLERYMAFKQDWILGPDETHESGASRLAPDGQQPDGTPIYARRLKLFRTEVALFDWHYMFAGMFDILFEKADGTYCLGDWKRSKHDLLYEVAYKNEIGWGPCANLPNVSRMRFTIQLTLYALCVMKFTGLKITELRLGGFHAVNKKYVWLKVEPVWETAREMLEHRRQRLLHEQCEQALQASRRNLALFRQMADSEMFREALKPIIKKAEEDETGAHYNLNMLFYNNPFVELPSPLSKYLVRGKETEENKACE